MSWYLARSLGPSAFGTGPGLFGETNAKYPNRDHASDGSVGDTSHSARESDHNPDPDDDDIVRATDTDSNGAPGVATDLVRDILKAVIGDPRVYYVIWNRKIYSRTYGFAARAYYGSNPHDHHVHTSVLAGPLENDTSAWFEDPPRKIVPKKVSVSRVRQAFRDAAAGRDVEFSNGVGRIQMVLNRQHGEDLVVDGIAGRATLRAWRRFEATLPEGRRQGQLRIPDRPSLGALGRGHFRLVR